MEALKGRGRIPPTRESYVGPAKKILVYPLVLILGKGGDVRSVNKRQYTPPLARNSEVRPEKDIMVSPHGHITGNGGAWQASDFSNAKGYRNGERFQRK